MEKVKIRVQPLSSKEAALQCKRMVKAAEEATESADQVISDSLYELNSRVITPRLSIL
jgi:hypothetical protein